MDILHQAVGNKLQKKPETIEDEIDAVFFAMVRATLQEKEKQIDLKVEAGKMDPYGKNEQLKHLAFEYIEYTYIEKVAAVVKNVWQWFPGGDYHEYWTSKRDATDVTNLQAEERLARAATQIVQDKHFTPYKGIVRKPDKSLPKEMVATKAKVLAEFYVLLRRQGFDHGLLTT